MGHQFSRPRPGAGASPTASAGLRHLGTGSSARVSPGGDIWSAIAVLTKQAEKEQLVERLKELKSRYPHVPEETASEVLLRSEGNVDEAADTLGRIKNAWEQWQRFKQGGGTGQSTTAWKQDTWNAAFPKLNPFQLIEERAQNFTELGLPHHFGLMVALRCDRRFDLLLDLLNISRKGEDRKLLWESFVEQCKDRGETCCRDMKRFFVYTKSEEVFIASAVRGASRVGNIRALRWLERARLWNPWDFDHARWAVEGADRGGRLMTFLGNFDVAISRTVAKDWKDRVIDEFKRQPREEQDAGNQVAQSDIHTRKPKWLEDFPNSLGVIYVKQVRTSSCQLIDDNKFLKIPDVEEWKGRGGKCRLGALSRLTLGQSAKSSALIPVEACWYAYVYASQELNSEFPGGFVYMDRFMRPIQLNCLVFDGGDYVFSFGKGFDVTDKQTIGSESSPDGEWSEVTVKDLKDKGAAHYVWLRPDSHSIGEQNKHGGFAYKFLFKDESGSREKIIFFPLLTTGEVVVRGSVTWEVNAVEIKRDDKVIDQYEMRSTDMKSARTRERFDDIEVLKAIITPMGWWKRWKWLKRRCCCGRKITEGKSTEGSKTVGSAMHSGKVVQFAYIGVPNAINSSLLYAILEAPRLAVARSVAAKAITCAAYDKIYVFYFGDFVLELLCFLALWGISIKIRGNMEDQLEGFRGGNSAYAVSELFVHVVWIKNILWECLLAYVFWKRSWLGTQLGMYLAWRGLTWINLAMLLFVGIWVQLDRGDHEQRIILSLAMACRVLKALSFVRTMETWSIGKNVLPVVSSISSSSSFFIVVSFGLVSAWSMFWVLSDKWTFEALLDVYKLVTLGDFELDGDIRGGISKSATLEDLAFVCTAFLLAISLMNILINILGGYYDHYQERVDALFVRARAEVCLTYLAPWEAFRNLCSCQSNDWRKETWCCHVLRDDDAGAEDISMRKQLKSKIGRVETKIGGIGEKVQGIETSIKQLQESINLLGTILSGS